MHCVIIGFHLVGADDRKPINAADDQDRWASLHSAPTRLFDYETPKSEPHEIAAKNINPYLLDAPTVMIESRTQPLCTVPAMKKGNQPTDGGNLLLSPEEKSELLQKELLAERWLRPILGADEFINGKERWCLWLMCIQPHELKAMPEVMRRAMAVRDMRLASSDPGTRELANCPTQFREAHEYESYVLVPSVSSERREYVPMGLFDGHTISSNLNLIIPGATLYRFGVLTSAMHMAWMRSVCGRLKSDYRYSAGIVYNNFPWPNAITDKQKQTIEAAYSKRKFFGDSDQVAFLFERYQQLVDGMEIKPAKAKRLN